uniref:Uncharacterized protein n=1 Tax=Trypanosoma congolense (strain IL3000) TaxID=1068625 RepID=G0UL87_TRYCI|nr:hypothetical protein, unlikely [Trypanosoma congolense IL3000]
MKQLYESNSGKKRDEEKKKTRLGRQSSKHTWQMCFFLKHKFGITSPCTKSCNSTEGIRMQTKRKEI